MKVYVVLLFLTLICIAYCQNGTRSSNGKSNGKGVANKKEATKPKPAAAHPDPPGRQQQLQKKSAKGPVPRQAKSPTRQGKRKPRSARWEEDESMEELKPKRGRGRGRSLQVANNGRRLRAGIMEERGHQRRLSRRGSSGARNDNARSLDSQPLEAVPQNPVVIHGFEEPSLAAEPHVAPLTEQPSNQTTVLPITSTAKVDNATAVEIKSPVLEVHLSQANETQELSSAKQLPGQRLVRRRRPFAG